MRRAFSFHANASSFILAIVTSLWIAASYSPKVKFQWPGVWSVLFMFLLWFGCCGGENRRGRLSETITPHRMRERKRKGIVAERQEKRDSGQIRAKRERFGLFPHSVGDYRIESFNSRQVCRRFPQSSQCLTDSSNVD